MKKILIVLLPLLAAAGALHAQVTDTNQVDSIYLSPAMKALEEVKITAERPLYTVDGEKQLYNTADDPSVQTGTASDALQNAPEVEVDAEGNITLRGSQSVEVWINDRPSHLSGEALRQYIKTLPASAITRIEVITNPSARYGGGGPVVNIVTTAKVSRNEFFSLGTTANLRPQVSPWLSYVYANDRFSINAYVEYDYSHTWDDQQGTSLMRTPQGDTSVIKSHTSHSDYRRHGSYFYVGGHYDFDTQRSLYFWAGAYPSTYRSESSTDVLWQEYLHAPGDYSFLASSSSSIPQTGYYGGLDYSHHFNDKGERLWLRAYANGFGYRSEGDQWRQYSQQPQLDFHLRDLSVSNSWGRTHLDAGYTLPFAEHWEWEVGAYVAYDFPISYDYTSDSLMSDGTVRRDLLRSYGYTGKAFGYEAYTTLQYRLGNLTAKAGLRAGESFFTNIYSSASASIPTSARWFVPVPSLHLSYRTASMHNFTFSYTRRMSTPRASQLTEFMEYHIESYSQGNPDLQPSHTHNLEAGWNKFFEGFGNVGVKAYYNANADEIGDLTDVAYSPVFGREVQFTRPVNIGSSHTGGLSLNLTYRPTAKLNVRLSANLFNQGYHLQFRPDEWYDESLWSGSVRLNTWAKLWDRLQLFGTLSYSTRRLTLMQYGEPIFTADAGVSADLWQRRLSLYLNIKDIFASNVQQWGIVNPYLATTGRRSASSRYVSVGVTFRFGKLELESRARKHEE